jgi:transcriptional regulator with XRE-family HTH domain
MEKELGERLRSYRVDSGMEIGELAIRTRITARSITALEEGQFHTLPATVFVRGFIRAICQELGRDPEALYAILESMSDEEPLEESDAGGNGSKRPAPLILSGVVLAVLVIGGILIHGKGNGEKPTSSAEEGVGSTVDQPMIESQEDRQGIQEAVSELDLLIRAIDKTWLRIQPDNAEPWETTMKAGDEISLKATDRVTLFIGNAGGVLFELNGKRFGPPGARGQVISNYTITRDDL